jgi:hypothetical protein
VTTRLDLVSDYLATTDRMLRARVRGDDAEEEICLSELDRIWWRMTEAQWSEVELRLIEKVEETADATTKP